MVKKIKQTADKQAASSAKLFDSALASSVKDSAQQIWLAGLGAFARAQAEGTKVFESLVKEGATVQKKTQSAAEEKISEVTGKVTAMAEDVQAKYGQQWGKLETIFEERTAKALNKLGVPSAKDVEALMKRIDDLSAQLAKLAKASAAKPATAAVPKAAQAKSTVGASNGATKPAAKRAASKRAASNQASA
ncbi:hypothetical protein BH11PSE8_BH11PSE8_45500 [soil metagenome]